MKGIKNFLIVFCIVAAVIGGAVGIFFIPTAKPAQREVLYEDAPAPDPLRTALEVNGVGGSRFFIQSPKTDALSIVYVSEFGADPAIEDNAEALNDAFEYCKDNPGTHLIFEKGTYHVSDRLVLKRITDACIDGNGAEIIHDYGEGLMNIEGCRCLEMRDLSIDWDWEKLPLSALARAVKVKGEKNTVDFIFDVPEYAIPEMFYAVSQCDEETGTYGARGTIIETYDGQNPDVFKKITKISDDTVRVVHNGALSRFDGKKFILRSIAYGGSLFNIGEKSRDITLNGLNLYGGTGMGIIVGERTSHFALRNIFIGPNPAYKDVHVTSLDADAVHINDSEGCFLIEGCDFSRQGDDDVNINSGIGTIKSKKGRTITVAADGSMDSEPGDIIAFRDKRFNMLSYTAVVESSESIGHKLRTITFRDDLPAEIKKGYRLFNAEVTGNNYVIRNNYFHEHRARGLLLQTSDGLVENNVFYKTSHDAIRIVMDISTGEWNEGTGADNIVIRNNAFINCGVIGTEVIEIGTHIDGKSGRAYAFSNIKIENNEFRDVCGYLMVINNVNDFSFKNNTVTLGTLYHDDIGRGRAYFMHDCANVEYLDNTYTDARRFSFARVIRSNSPFVWARINARALSKKGGTK